MIEASTQFMLWRLSTESGKCNSFKLDGIFGNDTQPERFRVLLFTCAGGHEGLGYLPTATRDRLLRRALQFQPHAVVANGDHVYWDIRPSGTGKRITGASPEAVRLAGTFTRSAAIFGHDNETVLKRAAGPQIIPVYGATFRSTPVFFLQDDHDHYDNDDATDNFVTYPPSWFMLQLARATQRLYYPEFLPDVTRPSGLPWSSSGDRNPGVSESFGTIRFGRLAEIVLYDVRRTLPLPGLRKGFTLAIGNGVWTTAPTRPTEGSCFRLLCNRLKSYSVPLYPPSAVEGNSY
jgi:hypothetical protein